MKTAIEKKYDSFKNCFELDVYFTIEKDLEEEARESKIKEVQTQSQYENKQKQKLLEQDLEATNKMLVLYFFGPGTTVEQEVRGPDGKLMKEKVYKEPTIEGSKLQPDYNFFVLLMKLTRQSAPLSADIESYKSAYRANSSKFTWPRDEKEVYRKITEFFSDQNFIKRVQLHQQHINKSKIKQKSILSLYYMELNDAQKSINLLQQKNAQ